MINIKCKLVEGSRVASGLSANSPFPKGTIEMRKPFFEEKGLLLLGFHEATLNKYY